MCGSGVVVVCVCFVCFALFVCLCFVGVVGRGGGGDFN